MGETGVRGLGGLCGRVLAFGSLRMVVGSSSMVMVVVIVTKVVGLLGSSDGGHGSG